MTPSLRPRLRAWPAALVVTALAPALVLGVPAVAGAAGPGHSAPPSASALGDAQARARQLRVQVDRLQQQAELATEAYDRAESSLGIAVTEQGSAQEALDRAVLTAGDRDRTVDSRVRALYMSGGAPALYASVLQGVSITDVLDRLVSVRAVVGSDRSAAAAAARSVAAEGAAEARLADLALQQTRLSAAVASRADQVRTLLAATDQLLSQADQTVRRLADEQRRAEEAAAAAGAAAALAAARQQAAAAAVGSLPDVPAPTPAAAIAVAEAERHLGEPYVWGATGPGAFDCSGLTQTAYRSAGLELPRVAADQYLVGPHVDLGSLAPGDLLFWATDVTDPATIHHVAIYIGNGQMVAAPHTGTVVQVQPVYLDGYIGATRPSLATPAGAPAQPDPTGDTTGGGLASSQRGG